jgi:hypothetical protein
MDGFARDSLTHAGRILLDLMPKIYDTARVVRILGTDDQPEIVEINRTFMGPDGKARNFDLQKGKYDVIVKVGPSFSTQREEVRTSMLEFIRMYPPAAPLLGPMLAKNMDWPEAEKVAQQLNSLLPPQTQGGDPQRDQMAAHIQQLTQQLQSLEQDKGNDSRKLDIEAFKAETDRLEAVAAAVSPEAIQSLVIQTVQQLLGSPDILPPAQSEVPPMPDMGMQPPDMGMPPEMMQQMPPEQMPPEQGFPQAPPAGAF